MTTSNKVAGVDEVKTQSTDSKDEEEAQPAASAFTNRFRSVKKDDE